MNTTIKAISCTTKNGQKLLLIFETPLNMAKYWAFVQLVRDSGKMERIQPITTGKPIPEEQTFTLINNFSLWSN